MAYDPNFPPDHQALNAAPFRNQFQGLKALMDAQAAQIATLQTQVAQLQNALAGKATRTALGELDPGYSDPPTYADLMAIQGFINDLVQQLQS